MHAKPERSTRFLLHVSVAHPNTFRLGDNGAQLIPRFRAKREGASEQGSALGGTVPGLVRGAMEPWSPFLGWSRQLNKRKE